MTRIVVADDEAVVAETTAELLRAYGHDVVSVGLVPEILPTVLAHRAELLLQDIRMPGMNLDAHLQGLRAHPQLRALRIVLFTASVGVDAFRHHPLIDGFMSKPFDATDLISVLDRAIALA